MAECLTHLESKILVGDSSIGLSIAIAIVFFWVSSLVLLLPLLLSETSLFWVFWAVMGRSFLHTGLFVIAHDAIHLSLIPQHRSVNDAIGRLAIWLYAFFPYEECRSKHWKHHRYPAQIGDPDFHNGTNNYPIFWYFKFMREYLPLRQLVVFLTNWGLIFGALNQIFAINLANFLLFWIVPLFLSSLQLFVFGTYLPHRGNRSSSTNVHHAQSSQYPVFWSFLTCYHFGYHWEHHEYPQTPWYRLPAIRYFHRNRAIS
ncbi:fatty acid desaturase [Merismopedia glauca]|uniref:Beta-carotene ketolase n=2 Tax=Merismopedia TaxID=53402 RepID=A0A2T1C7W0_9CYAN|nr:beta-carotene ketolase [Merismopedia glauca CCAP 1448/3]